MPQSSTLAPEISVVIAARNASRTISTCLEALSARPDPAVEIVVVDDASTDDTARLVQAFPVRLVRLSDRRGPAGARNEGVLWTRAPVVLFVDADTKPGPDTVDRARRLMADGTLAAVSGSYDDEPDARTLVSLFKNLKHHYFHARAAGPVSTFFAGCGVVRRETFLDVGGFDEVRYSRPSVEDIELGHRLSEAGAELRLDPSLQVKHLKRWTLASLLVTDFTRRAVPWTVLSLERGGLPSELNASPDQRLAALAALGIFAGGAVMPVWPSAVAVLAPALVAAGLLNRRLFGLFRRRGGPRLLVSGFVLQQLYYLYSMAGVAAGAVLFAGRRLLRRRTATGMRPSRIRRTARRGSAASR